MCRSQHKACMHGTCANWANKVFVFFPRWCMHLTNSWVYLQCWKIIAWVCCCHSSKSHSFSLTDFWIVAQLLMQCQAKSVNDNLINKFPELPYGFTSPCIISPGMFNMLECLYHSIWCCWHKISYWLQFFFFAHYCKTTQQAVITFLQQLSALKVKPKNQDWCTRIISSFMM